MKMLLVIYIVSEKRLRQAVFLCCFLNLAKVSSPIATMSKDESHKECVFIQSTCIQINRLMTGFNIQNLLPDIFPLFAYEHEITLFINIKKARILFHLL